MRAILAGAALAAAMGAIALSPTPGAAKGCIKGAIVGGVAGHYAGHHGLLGAGAGCVIGRHEANKHARERAEHDGAYNSQRNDGSGYQEGSGSTAPPYDRGPAPR